MFWFPARLWLAVGAIALALSQAVLPLARFAEATAAPRVAVLTYHHLSRTDAGPYTITPERLETDLRWFLDQGWRPLTLAEFQDWIEGRVELAGDRFLLTFDDGYASFVDEAMPVLERLDVPATVFVISGRLGPVDPERELPKLTPAQLASLVRSGLVDVASHTHDLHREVGRGDGVGRVPAVYESRPDELAADLDASIDRLRAATGGSPSALAWPYGHAPGWATSLAAERFPLIFTGQPGFVRRDRPHAIPRFAMESRTRAQLASWFAGRGAGATATVAEAAPRYVNRPAGYSVPLPSGWRVDDSKAPVVTRLVGPEAVIDVFDQKLDGITAEEYILYSNRSVTNAWNGHEVVQQGPVWVSGRPAYLLEWRRPPLRLVAPDLRNYAEWHLVRPGGSGGPGGGSSAGGSVLTVMVKATDAEYRAARRAAEQVAAGVRWLPREGEATWRLPRSPARDWTPWQDATELQWRMPSPGQLMWGMFDPRFEMKVDQFQLADFARFEREQLGTKLGLLMSYMNYGRPFPTEIMETTARDGRLMLLTLQTNPGDNVRSQEIYAKARTSYYRLLDGRDDEYLRAFARDARRFGKPFLFRFDNEMNGDWTAWSAFQLGKDTDLYVAAWRHVRRIFLEEGADNAIWVWNPNCESFPRFAWNHQSRYWPGADAVDLVGLTCYNTAGAADKWRSFESLYRPLYDEYVRLYGDKPFLITEFSSHTMGGDKAAWVREMFDGLRTMPNIRMAVWWNGADNIGNYWLTEPRGALIAFREGIRAGRFVNTVGYRARAAD